MSNSNVNPDTLNHSDFDRPSLPPGLNVLTILTFIGSGIQLLFVIFGFLRAQSQYDEKDKVLESIKSGEMPGWVKSIMPDPANYEMMLTKNLENKIPMLLLGVVAVFLCVYGAMQMRKLKKSGFTIYLVGQLLPFATTALFVGFFMFSGLMFILGCAITVLFILLYLTQRKHLVY
jgi:uncharacterized BrkB/YihY/UPF0761 family membrane protein